MPKPFDRLFPRPKPVIAMIHTGPSPGVPESRGVECAVERAAAEARLYAELGVDGVIVENMHDFPAVSERTLGPEVVAFMTRIACAVKRQVGRLPVGVQVLFQANKTALAVAHAAGCDFVRADGWAPASDDGAEAGAGEVLRYRKLIGADRIPVFADIRRPAADARTAEHTLADMAAAAARHRADGLIVTGFLPGLAPDRADLEAVADAVTLPVLVGGGLTPDNFADYVALADGFVIGSAFKEHGDWRGPVCERRVRRFIGTVEYARGQEVNGQ